MKQLRAAPSTVVVLICLIFSVFFTFFCGVIGYEGDSWNTIYAGLYTENFFHPQPEWAETMYLRHRPVFYAIGAYGLQKWLKLWQYPLFAHFVALSVLTLCVFLFGKVLEYVYPNQPVFIILALLLIFFHGHVFSSSFLIRHIPFFFTGITFWGMGICFFKLAQTRSWFNGLLYGLLSFVLYFLSVFTVELFALVILSLPLFIYFGKHWPIPMSVPDKFTQSILRGVLPAGAILGALLYVKYISIQHIGRNTNFSLPHFLAWLWKYWVQALMYGVNAVYNAMGSQYRYLALIVFIILLIIFYFLSRKEKDNSTTSNEYSPFVLGTAMFVLGVAPLIIAGYAIDIFSLDYSSGRYFSASFGVLLIFSGFLLIKKYPVFHTFVNVVICFLLACQIAFVFTLADGWKSATRTQKKLFTSLLQLCPDVDDTTNFIFLDTQVYTDFGVAIWGSPSSTTLLPRIIYDNSSLDGGLAYSGKVTHGEHTMIITRERIKPRTYSLSFSTDQVIIVKNIGEAFELIDLHKTDPLDAIWAKSYFEFTRSAFQNLLDNGLPPDIKDQLKPLKDRAFFKAKFLQAVEDQIGRKNTLKYQELLLKYTWNWTETYFEFTEQHWQHLKEAGMPEELLVKIEHLQGQAFVRDEDFLWNVADWISNELTEEYRALLVDHEWQPVETITEVRSNRHLIKSNRVENAFTHYLSKLPD